MTAAARKPGLTRSTEDYLKTIYELQYDGTPAQTSAIAEALDIAPPSVSGMVKRLSEDGYLEYVPYRGVELTGEGLRAALRMVRRHRIVETYLTTKLGYDWDSVHDEAERLEHAVSDELIERMAMALGNPQYDPHGAPIPTKEGLVEETRYVRLADLPVGEVAELRMVGDKDAERLRYVASIGLRPGVSFEVLARQPFQGPTTIRIGHSPLKEKVVGHELGCSLFCAPVGREVG
ncbi:MAG: metal-dependent transcriptional regulator [Gemmatimonadales bacterium]